MVFRTKINDDEYSEMLQICSQPITCTQPPGIPEICKKSLHVCAASGGQELFIIGKNFLKDTKVIFTQYAPLTERTSNQNPKIVWEQIVAPDKEYLQQTHLICVVPPYANENLSESVNVQICVVSSNKRSEAHSFTYTPQKESVSIEANNNNSSSNFNYQVQQADHQSKKDFQQIFAENPQNQPPNEQQMLHWNDQKSSSTDLNDGLLMMPPPSSTVPLNSINISSTNSLSNTTANNQEMAQSNISEPPLILKSEYIDENSMPSENPMDSSTSSPTVSTTTSTSLVPVNEMLFDQKASSALQSYPLLNNNTLMGVAANLQHNLQNPFVQVSASATQSQVEMMQNSNFHIKSEDIQQEQQQQQHCQEMSQQLNQNQLTQSELAAPLTPHEQQQVNFLNNFGQVSSADGLFQSSQQQLNDTLMYNAQQQQNLSQNLVQQTNMNQMQMQMDNYSSGLTSQDIILNSRSAVVLNNSANIQKQQTDQPMPDSISSSNIILNTQISPSMMCQNEQNLLAQVPMETNAIIMNNIIQSIDNGGVSSVVNNSNSIANDQSLPPPAPVAVKNMILNAAAEILNTNVNALMNTLNPAEGQPCMEITQTHANLHQNRMIYSTEMPPPPIPPARQNSQSMNDINMNMSLLAHKMEIVSKQDAAK